jgi:transcriptional regulator GlxA family with amidase domain
LLAACLPELGRICLVSVIAAKRRSSDDGGVRRVVILGFERAQTLDITGPMEVFSAASRLTGGAYEVELVTLDGAAFQTGSGLTLVPRRPPRGPLDTLLIAGGDGVHTAVRDDKLVSWVRRAAGRSRRVASVCSGAFLLAEAGLLDGRRAATHWAETDALARRHPEVEVDDEAIYVRDGDVWTSAGVTAGMDLALALVEEDLGREVSLQVARWLVVFVRRPGGQSQFSSHLRAQVAEREPLRELQEWMAANLDADLSVPALAARACMSERNFARAFAREVGMTPAAYVEALRVDHARMRLETTAQKVEAVAHDCGFGTVETLRRAFHRRLGVGPGDYRDRFQTRGEDDGDRHSAVRPLHSARRRRAV